MKLQQGLISWRRRVVAVDGGDGDPVVVRASRRGNRMSWRAIAPAEISGEDVVVAGLRPGAGLTAWVQAPLQSARKARQILPSVLDTKLPFPLEECAYALGAAVPAAEAPLPVGGEGTATLAVVARTHDLAVLEEELAAHAAPPHLFDHEGVALWSSLASSGHDAVQVVVWCRADSLVVAIGAGDVFWSSQRIAGSDIDRTMRWIRLQRQTTVGGRYKEGQLTWWVGGAAEQVDVFWSCLEGVSPAYKHRLPDGVHYLARVLAERALLSGRWRVPALPSACGREQHERFLGRRYLQNGVLCLLAALCLLAVGIGRRYYVQQQLLQEDQSVQRAVREIAGYEVVARGWHAVDAAATVFAERKDLFRGFIIEDDLSIVAGRVAAVCADHGGYLEALSVTPDSFRATVWLPVHISPDELTVPLREHGYVIETTETVQEEPERVQYRLYAERGMP